jgi:hypothetical protein
MIEDIDVPFGYVKNRCISLPYFNERTLFVSKSKMPTRKKIETFLERGLAFSAGVLLKRTTEINIFP